jgi:hypothetical protein
MAEHPLRSAAAPDRKEPGAHGPLIRLAIRRPRARSATAREETRARRDRQPERPAALPPCAMRGRRARNGARDHSGTRFAVAKHRRRGKQAADSERRRRADARPGGRAPLASARATPPATPRTVDCPAANPTRSARPARWPPKAVRGRPGVLKHGGNARPRAAQISAVSPQAPRGFDSRVGAEIRRMLSAERRTRLDEVKGYDRSRGLERPPPGSRMRRSSDWKKRG